MTLEELDYWSLEFEPPLTEGSEIRCPSCKAWACHRDWQESETYCEDCGTHVAIACPNCDHREDTVCTVVLKTRTK